MQNKNAGNVLFLILIAVALFAALSYAVTQSSRSSGDGVTKDKARLVASEIIQYATRVEQAVSRMRVIGRCTDTQINFNNAVVLTYNNTTAPSDGRCDVFGMNGGTLIFQGPPKNATTNGNNWVFNGANTVSNVGTGAQNASSAVCPGSDATACSELVMILQNIDKTVCLEINKKLGIPERSAGNPPQDNGSVNMSSFVGTYAATTALGDVPAQAHLHGKLSGCFEGDSTPAAGTYHYYHVLLTR